MRRPIYLTLAPQFLAPGRPVLGPMLVLATAHAALATCWLAGWTVVSGAAARLWRLAAVRRLLDRLAGAARPRHPDRADLMPVTAGAMYGA